MNQVKVMLGRLAGLSIALVLLAAAGILVAHAESNYASYGPVTFYTDKAEYLPGETVEFTIIVNGTAQFTERIDIYVYLNGELTYLWHYPAENGTTVTFYVTSADDATVIRFYRAFEESGTYTVKLAIPSLNIPATALSVTFKVGPRYEIVGKVVDESGNPVAGAIVKVIETGATTTTDENGEFSIGVPSTGTYTLVVTANDFLPSGEISVEVTRVGKNDAGVIEIESVAHAIASLREALSQLETRVAELEKALKDVSGQVAALTDRTSKLESALADVKETVGQLSSALDELSSRLDAVSGEVTGLREAFNEFKSSVESALNELRAAIERLSGELEDVKAGYATKDELNARIADVNAKIGDLEKRINELERTLTDRINALNQELDNLRRVTIEQLSNNIKQLTTSLDELTGKLEGISTMALVAVILAIIGIVIAVVAAFLVYRRITA